MGEPATSSRDRAAHRWPAAGLGGLAAASTTVAALLLGKEVLSAWPGTGPGTVEAALLTVTLGTAAGLLCWVTVVLALAVLELLLGPAGGPGPSQVRPARACLPSPPRTVTGRAVRWVAATLLILTSAPAHAAPATRTPPSWPATASQTLAAATESPEPEPTRERPLLPDGSPVPLPGWTPAPTPAPVKPTAAIGLVSAAPREAPTEHVVVRAGDTLWALAARHLGPHATVQDIAEEWPRWYAANRDVIGADPDLILPGQELRVPGPGTSVGAAGPAGGQARP